MSHRHSRALTKLLRWSNKVDKYGYMSLSDVVKHLPKMSRQQIIIIATQCKKQRFHVDLMRGTIKCHQGHGLGIAPLLHLTRIWDVQDTGACVHGTTPESYKLIMKSGGLSSCKRQHIHFAMFLPQDNQQVSGMRPTSTVHIYLDVEKCLLDGIAIYRTDNNVILSRGVTDPLATDVPGFIPVKYFKTIEFTTVSQE